MVNFVFVFTILLLLNVTTTMPTDPDMGADPKERMWICKNGGQNMFYRDTHTGNSLRRAPIKEGKSGYPHRFFNNEGINFDRKPCNKTPTANRYLLEFPILVKEGSFFDPNTKRTDNLEGSRLIYT
ncbi:hypothetical protein BS50DRAFT_634158 [Corynespora cassiicola Philippines]|uniref:Uncharacterized protein n=1 Tax=Corynespora cassiicola Philippines TaxID=1448308 RepID=A0A2T2NNK9_CORCC|nr:hypothetical protein BS50DRAFT_634158 [Corynespora cassiicola Philippines]